MHLLFTYVLAEYDSVFKALRSDSGQCTGGPAIFKILLKKLCNFLLNILSDRKQNRKKITNLPMAQATFPEWQVLPKKIVYYDLKTTNSKKMPLSAREIVSIGATCNGSIDDFFVEIIPNHPIDPKRSKLYGYTIQREKLIYTDQNGVEREVTGAVTIENALEKFIQYLVLVKFTNDLATEASEKIILVCV